MIDTTNITNRVLYDSLLSDTCPACGGPKVKRQTLCRREYFKLSKPMRNATYATIASGNYRPAVIEALNFLGAEKFHLPEAKDGRPHAATATP